MGPLEPTIGVGRERLVRMWWAQWPARVDGVECLVAGEEANPGVACRVARDDCTRGGAAGAGWAERYGRCSCWIKNNNYGERVHATFTGCLVPGSTGSLRSRAWSVGEAFSSESVSSSNRNRKQGKTKAAMQTDPQG